MNPSRKLLEVRGLSKQFGGLKAVENVSFQLDTAQILGLIGPNGSGKTTVVNLLTGLLPPSSGRVLLSGTDVTTRPCYERARLGINRTFQIPKPLKSFTVLENVELARKTICGNRASPSSNLDILEMVALSDKDSRPSGELTSSQQKRLDLARALATNPQVILVDEIAAGLTPSECIEIADILGQLKTSGIALIVIEHIMTFMRSLGCPIVVMNEGKIIFNGTLDAARDDQLVRSVFFGSERGTF